MKKQVTLCFTLAMVASSAHAQFEQDKAYVGGGLGLNTPDDGGFDSALGFQLFAGYELPFTLDHGINFTAEAGYKYKGDFQYHYNYNGNNYRSNTFSGDGLWVGGLGKYPIDDKVDILARVGYDFGDFDGLHIGGGAEYAVTNRVSLRAEYVIGSDLNSAQLNTIYHF